MGEACFCAEEVDRERAGSAEVDAHGTLFAREAANLAVFEESRASVATDREGAARMAVRVRKGKRKESES